MKKALSLKFISLLLVSALVAAPEVADVPSQVAITPFSDIPAPVAAPKVAEVTAPVASPQVAEVPAPVANPQVAEIVNKANLASYYAANDGRADVNMTITDSQGRTREREFVITRLDVQDGGDQKFFVSFRKPSDVRKMVYMVHKHLGKDDDRWMYLPALDLVKRIAASDERTSFVGSDFLYEDVSGRSPEEDHHTLAGETEEAYILKSIPKNPSSVEFSSSKIWVGKKNFLPLKAELYKGDQVYRTMTAEKVEIIQGHPVVMKSVVENHETGGKTVLEFSNVQFDAKVEDELFTERYLRNPPKTAR